MIYRDFKDLKLSMLGFGTMRLPLKEDQSINEDLVAEMTDSARTRMRPRSASAGCTSLTM